MRDNEKPDWYKFGTRKNGDKMPARSTPKIRLTTTQAKILQLFIKDDTPKPMLQVLAEYSDKWPKDKLTEAKTSRDLKELKQDGFLSSSMAVPTMISKHTHAYAYTKRKKMIFYLSQSAKSGSLAIDSNRWVILGGQYIASDTLRRVTEARERAKMSRST